MAEHDTETSFALRIATINALGYALTVLAISYLDPQLTSHVEYGARTYPYGYWISLLAIPVFVATALIIRRARSRAWKCVGACVPLLVAAACSIGVFLPELPHGGLIWCVGYGFASVSATWLRHSAPNLSFVRDASTPVESRMAALKGVLSAWQALAIAAGVGIVGVIFPWASSVLSINEYIVKSEDELFLLNRFALMQVAAVTIALLVGPIRELFARLVLITHQFTILRGREPRGKRESYDDDQ